MRTALACLLLSACTAADPAGPTTAPAPLIGAADGGDAADTGCHLVLRDAYRPPAAGGFATECVAGQCWFVWEGSLDVSTQAVTEGADPALLYQSGSDPTWYLAEATDAGAAAPGFRRYTFRFFEHTVSPGMSLSSLLRTRIRLAPYLHTAGGGRLFDHNRNPDPLASYELVADNDWSLADDPAVCAARNAPPVELAAAQVAARVEYPNLQTSALRTIVRAPSSADEVVVHYQIRVGDAVVRDWTAAPASPAGDGLWELDTPAYQEPCPHYCPRHVYQLAVAATIDGVTHWDNGGGYGVDYLLASDVAGSVPTDVGPPALLDGPLWLAYALREPGATQAHGEIVLANLAYAKELTVVYSTDDWQTVNEQPATFDRSSSDGLEYWRFAVPVEAGSQLAFALRYRVDGQTYWDNNLGRDYLLPAM